MPVRLASGVEEQGRYAMQTPDSDMAQQHPKNLLMAMFERWKRRRDNPYGLMIGQEEFDTTGNGENY